MLIPHLCILTLFVLFSVVIAVSFDQCIVDVRSGIWGNVGGTDNYGNPVSNISNATSITYELCILACGAGPEPFVWNIFSQQFSAWLLPFLALVAQLPFGATDKLDNVVSVLLSVGSPTLAAYSLALTVLNGHWIARRFSRFSPPVKIETREGVLASLVVLPENDKWWTDVVEWLDYTHTFTISSIASILWVTIAFLFTVIDSFTGTIEEETLNANGQGVGSVYLWLLPVVIGWLQVGPKCDSTRLHRAIDRANHEAYVADSDGKSILANEAPTSHRAISLWKHRGSVHRDEQASPPVYNYARFFGWVQAVEEVYRVFEAASARAEEHDSVDPLVPWVLEEKGSRVSRSHWGPNVFSRFFVSSLLALCLTWATVGSAVIVVWFTPTRGLGCRSGAYLLYGALSTVVWMMLVTSSALAHYSTQVAHDVEGQLVYTTSTRIAGKLSIILRRLGKGHRRLQRRLDRTRVSVLGLGRFAYDVIQLVDADISTMKTAWIGGVALAGGSSVLFVVFVNIFMNPPLPPA
ncbi:hypothetical protein MVEN_00222500 [Mycena venus]|uniref:Uncharacterized protein n=1 Tax=Mycena venus TaxID=2733690 RepID=A0A8H6Z1I9_9AGAR|nr:hypothetical protein MVEN_00222500 [Mycena venus]